MTTYSPARIAAANRCAAAGVLLLMWASLSPADWHPVFPLFFGLGLIAVAHVLTPCQERLDQWRRAHAAEKPPTS